MPTHTCGARKLTKALAKCGLSAACFVSKTEETALFPAISETGATGLEPATSGVTGRRSNQLNYAPGRTNLSRVARPPDAGLYEVSPGAGSGAAGRPAPADGRPIPS